LPLAARVGPGEGRTLVCHGGLFRAPPPAARRDALKQAEQDEAATQLPLRRLGTLQQLRAGSRGSRDPDGIGHSQLAADVLWSDPRREDGVVFNALRGIGLVYGPDATAAFLADNGLTLVIRSHEGPDARDQREGMGSMQGGWCVDHDTPAGRLATLFSAPDYPQFSAEGETRYNNTAAIAVLTGPHYDAPEILNFQAAPRPPAVPYYDLGIAGSDEEGPDGALAAGAAAAAAPADASEPAAEPVAAPAVVPQVEAEPAAAAVPEEEHAAEPEIASVPEPATQQVAEPAAEPASEPSAELQPVAEPAEAEPVAVLAAPELVLPPEPEAAAMFDAPDEAAAMPELQ
jgi:serine/threonine-protein phosphatase 5